MVPVWRRAGLEARRSGGAPVWRRAGLEARLGGAGIDGGTSCASRRTPLPGRALVASRGGK